MSVYNIATAGDVTPGYYFNDGTKWVKLGAGASGSEPWNVQGTTTDATDNAENIYQMGSVAIGRDEAATGVMLDVEGAIRAGSSHQGNVGSNSAALGFETQASGQNAAAFGQASRATGLNAMAWGGQPTHGDTPEGRYAVASGIAATAWGYGTRATNFGATAFGQGNQATAPQATSFGAGNSSTGFWSTSFGQRNVASGNNSTAFGTDNVSTGNSSLAFGQNNKALQNGATALGSLNSAKGRFSFASGNGNVSATLYEATFGRFNADTTSMNATTWVATDAVLQIGNGTNASTRRNAVTVLKNGRTAIGTHEAKPNSTLQVHGSVSMPIRSVTGNTTLTDADYTVVSRNTAETTITLPDPATCAGRMYYIINNGTHSITTSLPFEVSTGVTQDSIPVAGTGIGFPHPNIGQKYLLQSDGTMWVLISLG